MSRDSAENGIKTTSSLFDIIESIFERRGATITEISNDVGLAKSTVHSHLTTLVREEYIVKSNGNYQLGLEFLKFGTSSRNDLTCTKIVQPILERLSHETGHVVWYVVPEYNKAVFISYEVGEKSTRTIGQVGRRIDLHCLAEGKAILAQMNNSKVDNILDKEGMDKKTENTITDRETLFEELNSIREQGYARSYSEANNGVRAVAAPIAPNEDQLGAISIVGPKYHLRGEKFLEEYPDQVLGAANEIELKMNYSK